MGGVCGKAQKVRLKNHLFVPLDRPRNEKGARQCPRTGGEEGDSVQFGVNISDVDKSRDISCQQILRSLSMRHSED